MATRTTSKGILNVLQADGTGFEARFAKLALRRDVEEEDVEKPTLVIDRRYPLSEVPAAIRYSEEGHARGKIVVNLE